MKSETIVASISSRIHEMEGIISGRDDTIKDIDTSVKENTTCKGS